MLKLHAGISKKVGLPGFSSASASCTIEAELDSGLLQDHEGFQVVVQRAYASCEKAVQDQITRLTCEDQPEPFSRIPAGHAGDRRSPHQPSHQRHHGHAHPGGPVLEPAQPTSRHGFAGQSHPGHRRSKEDRPLGPAA
jgi:hypothetical protein